MFTIYNTRLDTSPKPSHSVGAWRGPGTPCLYTVLLINNTTFTAKMCCFFPVQVFYNLFSGQVNSGLYCPVSGNSAACFPVTDSPVTEMKHTLTHAHTHSHTHTYTQMHTCTQSRTHTLTRTCTHAHNHARTHTHAHSHTCTHTLAHMHTIRHTHTHARTHSNT
jgi:hypothetical protein